MSDMTFFEPSHYAVTKLFRRIAVIAVVGALVLLANEQIIGALDKCLQMLLPGPSACPVTEATLPDDHSDSDGPNAPSQLPGISQLFITKTTSATSITPCPDPGVKFSVH